MHVVRIGRAGPLDAHRAIPKVWGAGLGPIEGRAVQAQGAHGAPSPAGAPRSNTESATVVRAIHCSGE